MSQENPRNNKEIVKEINVASTPDAGTKMPAGKPENYNDALGKNRAPVAVRQAEEVKGAAKKARDVQEGKHKDDMTQPHSGINDEGENDFAK